MNRWVILSIVAIVTIFSWSMLTTSELTLLYSWQGFHSEGLTFTRGRGVINLHYVITILSLLMLLLSTYKLHKRNDLVQMLEQRDLEHLDTVGRKYIELIIEHLRIIVKNRRNWG